MRLLCLAASVLALRCAGFAAMAPSEAQDARRYFYEDIFTPFFAADEGNPGLYRNRRPYSSPASFLMPKPAGAFRVFVVGGSIAKMAMTHDRSLAEALEKVLPSRKTEVIGCGMPGYDSYREAMVIQEILEYEPDLIVLMTGHNEYLGSAPIPLWRLRAREKLERWPAFRALAKGLGALSGRGAQPRSAAELARKRDRAFALNLRANIRNAVARGAAVAVISPPLNYRDAPATSPAPMANPLFVRGWIEYLKGDCAAAGRLWGEALPGMGEINDSGGNRSLTYFFRGRCLEKLGRPEEAFRDYRDAILSDLGGNRCSPRCMDEIRAAAGEEGAIWADVDAEFRGLASSKIPGSALFDDHLHWRYTFNGTVTLKIVEALMSAPQKLAGLKWDRGAHEALRRRWRVSEKDMDKAFLGNTLKSAYREMSPESPQVFWPSVFFLSFVYDHKPGWFSDVHGLKRRMEAGVNEGQVEASVVTDGRLYWHLGEMYLLRRDFARAKEHLQEALKIDPGLQRARLSLGVAQAFLGDAPGALRSIEAARADTKETEALAGALGLKMR